MISLEVATLIYNTVYGYIKRNNLEKDLPTPTEIRKILGTKFNDDDYFRLKGVKKGKYFYEKIRSK